MFELYLFEDCTDGLKFDCQLIGVGSGVFIDVKVEKELNSVGNGHVLGVVDEVMKYPCAVVDTCDCLFVSVIEQAEVGPKEVACQQRKHFGLVQHGVEQVDIQGVFDFALFEKAVENAGGLGLDYFDDL
jgi:hypothetical protein